MLHSNSIRIEHGRLYGLHYCSRTFGYLHSGSSDAILNLLNQNLSPSGSFTKCDSQFIESLFISIRIICPNAILLVQVWNCDCVPVIECCDVECWSAVLCTVLCANTMPIKPRGNSQLVSWGCFIKGCAEACRKMIQLMKSAGIVT